MSGDRECRRAMITNIYNSDQIKLKEEEVAVAEETEGEKRGSSGSLPKKGGRRWRQWWRKEGAVGGEEGEVEEGEETGRRENMKKMK